MQHTAQRQQKIAAVAAGQGELRAAGRGQDDIDDTLPGGPVERTIVYEAPFDLCDRVADYRVAWGMLEESQ